MSVAPLARTSFPRILPTTTEFLQTAPFADQKEVAANVGGDDQKRTPEGKPILSTRARLLHRRQHQDRRGGLPEPAYVGDRPLPRSLAPAATSKRGGHVPKTSADRRPGTSDRYRGFKIGK